MSPGYLTELTVRLASGVERMSAARRAEHAAFVTAAQRDDGGFSGREGGSDLYYTGFALRSLAILGELDGPLAERAAGYLKSRLGGQETVVDFLSLFYGAALLDSAAGLDVFEGIPAGWQDRVASILESLRRPDGGYAKAATGTASSTYHSFLVLLCLQLLERPVPKPSELVAFLLSQQAEGGGFREIRVGKRAGTNPTAAAIGALRILGALTPNVAEATIDFLADMQTDEGGLRANTRIPIADLLSTFTGLLTLSDLDGLEAIDLQAVVRYVHSLRQPEGGFLGAAWDQRCDVEYTFYGLASAALLAREATPEE